MDRCSSAVCCEERGANQLCTPAVGEVLLKSARDCDEHARWFMRRFLFMPDHVHALLSFPRAESMAGTTRDWKRYTTRSTGVSWQRNFFDRRLSGGENWQLKADYIRANPARKGLVARPEDWPWILAR